MPEKVPLGSAVSAWIVSADCHSAIASRAEVSAICGWLPASRRFVREAGCGPAIVREEAQGAIRSFATNDAYVTGIQSPKNASTASA